jgi:hypothetical protein
VQDKQGGGGSVNVPTNSGTVTVSGGGGKAVEQVSQKEVVQPMYMEEADKVVHT